MFCILAANASWYRRLKSVCVLFWAAWQAIRYWKIIVKVHLHEEVGFHTLEYKFIAIVLWPALLVLSPWFQTKCECLLNGWLYCWNNGGSPYRKCFALVAALRIYAKRSSSCPLSRIIIMTILILFKAEIKVWKFLHSCLIQLVSLHGSWKSM